MAARERNPTELARFIFIITLFGVAAWIALAWAVMQFPNDPQSVQERDYETSVWLAQQNAIHEREPHPARDSQDSELANR